MELIMKISSLNVVLIRGALFHPGPAMPYALRGAPSVVAQDHW
jgi:hypothetical protein